MWPTVVEALNFRVTEPTNPTPDHYKMKERALKTIGLIGGVASGKSTVAGILKELGSCILDADRLGHQCLEQEEIIEKLVLRWGIEILTADSTPENSKIERKEVAKIVFGGDDQAVNELKWLESVTHPVIGQMMEEKIRDWKKEGSFAACLLDAPILLKAGWDKLCDEIIFVDCPLEIRWQRASQRGWTREHWENRERMQTPLPLKRARSTFIVDNSTEMQNLKTQLQGFWNQRIATSPKQ